MLFAKELNKKLDIGLHLSTPYHPQTDGLTEQAIQTLKQYLCIFYHDRQNRWTVWLALAEFAYNTTKAIHSYSPYRALYGFDLWPIQINNKPVASPAAEEWLDQMTMVHAQIQQTLK